MIHSRSDYGGIQDTTQDTNIEADEPVFVIRAKDKIGARVVRYWAQQALREGTETRTVDAAAAWADEMEHYRATRFKGGKVPDVPDGLLFTEQDGTRAIERLMAQRDALAELLETPIGHQSYWIGCRVCLRACVRRSDGGPVPERPGYGHAEWCPVPAVLAAETQRREREP